MDKETSNNLDQNGDAILEAVKLEHFDPTDFNYEADESNLLNMIQIQPEVEVKIEDLFYHSEDHLATSTDQQYEILFKDEPLSIKTEPIEEDENIESTSPVITASYSLGIEHKCSKCAQTFSTSNEALDHENQHGNRWTCRFCFAGFKTKATLLIHTKSVHSEDVLIPNSLNCLECNETFPNHHQKAVHDKNIHKNLNGFKYRCFECVQGFANRSQWMIHRNAHKKKKNQMVKCPLCPEVFTNDRRLQSHKQAKHKDPSNKLENCSKCDEVFTTIGQLTAHANSHGDKWPCDLCPTSFKQTTTVLKHRMKFHPDATTKYDFQPKITFKCFQCIPIREFDTSYKQILHIEENHKETFKFQCSKCGEKFRILSQKIKHEKSHPISCPQCSLTFYGDPALLAHQLTSHSAKVKCSKCDEIFPTEIQRDRHEMKHGDDDWPCLLCPVGFRSKQSVLNHRKKFHPGAKEYTYEKPNNINSTLSALLRSQKKPLTYKCKKCPRTLPTKLALRNHMKTHGTEWICEVCSVGFKHQVGLTRHLKAKHPKVMKKYRWKREKPEETSPQNYDVVRNVRFRCSKCGVTFGTAYHKKLHECKGVQSEMVPCGLCPAVFATVGGVDEHRRMIHGAIPSDQVPDIEETVAVDPSSFVSVLMEDVNPDVNFEASNQNNDAQVNPEITEESNNRVNQEELFVKPELKDLFWLTPDMEY